MKKKKKGNFKKPTLQTNVKAKKKLKGQVAALKAEAAKYKRDKKLEREKAEVIEKKKRERKKAIALKCPYSKEAQILLLGEGNFSFAAALAKRFDDACSITATCYDSAEVLHKKYEDAAENISFVEGLGGTVLTDVDGTALQKCLPLTGRTFDFVVLNFPHTGSGIKDTLQNIADNQRLIVGVMQSSLQFLSENGELHVTVKKGPPYDDWRVARLARDRVPALRLKNAPDFAISLYPGYEHRRTIGFKTGVSEGANADLASGAKTFMFVRAVKAKKKGGDDGNGSGSGESSGED